MMICPGCNKVVPGTLPVCPHCGMSMQTVNKPDREQALNGARGNVRGNVSGRAKIPQKKKKAFGIPGKADYIRMVLAVIMFILMCLSWYKMSVGAAKPEIFSMTIFGTGRGGIFAVPVFFGVLSIILLVIMITNSFLNFSKVIPALKKTNTLRLIFMLYAVSYIVTLFFALCSVIFNHDTGWKYSLTGWFAVSVIVTVIYTFLTFTTAADRRFDK